MSLPRRSAPGARGGHSLVELLVAIVVLSIGLLALAAGAGVTLRDMSSSRRDFAYWGDVQQVTDSLLGRGWNNVATGSTTVRGRAISWTVTTETAGRQRLDISVARSLATSRTGTATDAIVLYLAKPTS